MVFYFSGTGNSKYVAQQIAAATEDQVVSINASIKQNKTEEFIIKDSPVVFVCPTYAWRLPRVAEAFIRNNNFFGGKKAYFILTCASEAGAGNAIHYIKKLCEEKNWALKGFSEIFMPDNYIVLSDGPDEKTTKGMISKAMPDIQQAALAIKQGHTFFDGQGRGIYSSVISSVGNRLFYSFFIHTKGFHATDKCTGCAKCEKRCPLNNISIKNQKPVWGNTCTHCMACINRCPAEAIEYKRRTQKRARYNFEKIYK